MAEKQRSGCKHLHL